MKRIALAALLLCIAAAPTTKPDKPQAYTLEQIIRAVPKAERPKNDGEWTEAQAKRLEGAIAAVLDGKTVTLKALRTGLVKPKGETITVSVGTGPIALGGLYASLVAEAAIVGDNAAVARDLAVKETVDLSGQVTGVKVKVQTIPMVKGHMTTIDVELSDASISKSGR